MSSDVFPPNTFIYLTQHKTIELCGSHFDPSNPAVAAGEASSCAAVAAMVRRELGDADLAVVLQPADPAALRGSALQQLLQTLVDRSSSHSAVSSHQARHCRSATGAGYSAGGGLGLVTLGPQESQEAGLTLAIRSQVEPLVAELVARLLGSAPAPPTAADPLPRPPRLRQEVEYERCGCR